MTESQEESGNTQELAAQALGGTLAAILGAATGPLAPFTAAAMTPLLTRMARLIVGEWSRKNSIVMAEALQTSGLNEDEFCERLAEDPALMGLTQRILWAASVSGNDHKLHMFGKLLGGAAHGDKIDETGLIVNALTDLETPHIAVLNVLARPAPDEEEQRRGTANSLKGGMQISPPRTGDELMTWAPGAWLPGDVQNELTLAPGFAFACVSVLTRHNLARTLTTYGGGQRFQITEFGRAMLEAMSQTPVETGQNSRSEPEGGQ